MVLEYEAQFYELARYTTIILLIEYEQIWCSIRGLRLLLRIATHSLVSTSRSFIKVFDYAQTMWKMHCEA